MTERGTLWRTGNFRKVLQQLSSIVIWLSER
jgi:hypothetical protein